VCLQCVYSLFVCDVIVYNFVYVYTVFVKSVCVYLQFVCSQLLLVYSFFIYSLYVDSIMSVYNYSMFVYSTRLFGFFAVCSLFVYSLVCL